MQSCLYDIGEMQQNPAAHHEGKIVPVFLVEGGVDATTVNKIEQNCRTELYRQPKNAKPTSLAKYQVKNERTSNQQGRFAFAPT